MFQEAARLISPGMSLFQLLQPLSTEGPPLRRHVSLGFHGDERDLLLHGIQLLGTGALKREWLGWWVKFPNVAKAFEHKSKPLLEKVHPLKPPTEAALPTPTLSGRPIPSAQAAGSRVNPVSVGTGFVRSAMCQTWEKGIGNEFRGGLSQHVSGYFRDLKQHLLRFQSPPRE